MKKFFLKLVKLALIVLLIVGCIDYGRLHLFFPYSTFPVTYTVESRPETHTFLPFWITRIHLISHAGPFPATTTEVKVLGNYSPFLQKGDDVTVKRGAIVQIIRHPVPGARIFEPVPRAKVFRWQD